MRGKDPAFLFYDGDAARDVSHMNRLERGCYFDLIQAQRKFGGYTVEQARKILGKDFETCWEALELVLSCENGRYFIEWVDVSIKNRVEHSKKQRDRIQNYWNKVKSGEIPRNNPGITTVIPLENENENENENINKDVNESKNENEKKKKKDFLDEILDIWIDEYKKARGIDYVVTNKGKERSALSKILAEAKRRNPKQNSGEVKESCKDFFKNCLDITDKWLFENMNPSIIWSQFNKINQQLSDGKTRRFNAERKFSEIDFTIFDK